MSEVKGDQTTW